MIRKRTEVQERDIGNERHKERDRAYMVDGFKLYSAVPLMYPSGVYRLLCAKNFAKEKGLGFGLEILFSVLLLIVQLLNNSGLKASSVEIYVTSSDPFRQAIIILKFA